MALRKTISGFTSAIGADVLWQSSRDLKLLILLRMVRLLGYGGTTFILALYLHAVGFKDADVGLFLTLTLVGDLAISFGLTYVGDGMGVRFTAIVGALLMCASGIAFAVFDNYWLLLLASIVGVINPSANEIDPFKAVEESAIARLSTPETCSDLFAWWSMLGMLGTAASNLLTGILLTALQENYGFAVVDSHRVVFLAYSAIGLIKLLCCLLLSRDVELKTAPALEYNEDVCSPILAKHPDTDEESSAADPLLQSSSNSEASYSTFRDDEDGPQDVQPADLPQGDSESPKRLFTPASFAFMWRLSLAMAFDFVGSGLAQISWMTYFFKREYDVPEGALGSAIFVAGIISSLLNLASSPLARAIGQVPTMVLCHTINSISLMMVSVSGNKYIGLALFIFRIVTRELDNAPRQAFISAGVLDSERTSAMGVVNIVKTVGSCAGLYATGLFAGLEKFWLAFVVAGCFKLVYNVLISAFFWTCPKPRPESSY